MPTDPDQLERDRARVKEVTARWNPSLFSSTHEQRMTWWKLGKERGWLRRRIEAAEKRRGLERNADWIEVKVVTRGDSS